MVFAAADFDCVFTWVWGFVLVVWVWGLGYGAQESEYGVWGLGFGVWGVGFKV